MTKLRHLICMAIAAAGLMLSVSHSFAQQPDQGDQPGLIADDSYELDPEWRKQMVYLRTTEAPGTIIISTAERHLYLVQPGGRALRYGIGVGRDGFQWQGLLSITRKAEWPDWTPPPEMIAAPTLSAAFHGRRTRQSAWRARDVSRHHGLSHSRHQPAGYDRHQGLLRLLPPGQCRRRRSLRSRAGRHQGRRSAEAANCNRGAIFQNPFHFPDRARDRSCGHSEAAC